MVFSKGDSSSCELYIGDGKANQVQEFNYLGNEVTGDMTCDTEIRKCK